MRRDVEADHRGPLCGAEQSQGLLPLEPALAGADGLVDLQSAR